MKQSSLILLLVGLLFASSSVQIESIYATSTASPGSTYSVYNLFDNDTATLWQTAPGTGPEEGIMIYFKTPVVINGLEFKNFSKDTTHTYSYKTYVNGSQKELKYNTYNVRSLFIKFYGHKTTNYQIQDKGNSYHISSPKKQKEVSIGEIRFLKGSQPYTIQLPTQVTAAISASSTLIPQSAYSVYNLFDARKEFTWCEGVTGDGLGEKLTFNLPTEQTVTGLRLWNGYQRSLKHFKANGRAKQVKVSDGTHSELITLKDSYGVQEVRFQTPFRTTPLTLEIVAVYKGEKYADLCISELSFLNGKTIIKVDNAEHVTHKRAQNEIKYANTLLGTLLNKVITKNHEADGEDDFDEDVTLILRSDNTFVYYSNYGDAGSGDTKNIVADGNWFLISQSAETQTIKLFGQWLNISEISEVYSGTTKSSYQRIFQDKITLRKKSYAATNIKGLYKPLKEIPEHQGARASYKKSVVALSGGKFLSSLYYETE